VTRTSLNVPVSVRRAIVAHARRDRPLECCGLLIGRGRNVLAVLPAANLARSTVRYRLDPRVHIDARRWLRQCEPPLEILGCYHSHPDGPARPSPTDISEAAYPEWVYLIVGLRGSRAEVAAFRLRAGGSTTVRVGSSMARKR
jgi:proteasome lid subunit RPN8/RPN11